MKRLDVTGARGFVAGHVLSQAGTEWEVHGLSRGERPEGHENVAWHTSDLLRPERIRELFETVQPHAVIHAAAIADIDYCKAHPIEAQQTNVVVTTYVAKECARADARLVYVSTDNVFDGERGRYREDDAAHPVNEYGRSKLAGEHVVQDTVNNHVISRLALVAGLPVSGEGNAFLQRMLARLQAGETLGVPENEIRSPIDVATTAAALIELAGNEVTGIIHLAGNDVLSRLDMARRIVKALAFDPKLVEPTDPRSIRGRDERPRDVSLDNARARATLTTAMLGLEEGLANAGVTQT